MNEQDQFLSDLDSDQNRGVDVLEAPLFPPDTKADEATGDQTVTEGKKDDEGADDGDFGDLKPKTRRERRLMRKLNDERDSSIFLSGKLQAREEARVAVNEESDYLKAVERIYGTETPEAILATDLLKKAIIGARDDAENRALKRIEEAKKKDADDAKRTDGAFDDILDDIEDSYNVELNPAQEKAYFTLLKKMSPKDTDGKIVALADPHAVFESFQEKLKAAKTTGTATRAKDLSNRSMTQSGASTDSTLKDDAATRFLKDNGII